MCEVYQICNRQHTFTMSSHSSEVHQPRERQRTVLILSNMTLKSHCTHQRSETGSLWNNTHCPRQHICKSQHNYLTRTHPMDQRRPKPHRFHSCLMFRLKNCVRMEQRQGGGDVQADNTESRLRELALKWFTETQAPLILHNGNFPEWFQGFISRKDAEENLKDKKLGCFLIRLSDKATGYILSYKGRDRCRHFVINQNKEGRFIVTGDTEMHDSLTSLIEYYKISPIEPFGEYLTSSCFETSTSELYDVIHVELREKLGVNVKAVKDIWDHQPPALPPKGNRNMQAAPPLPRKGLPVKTYSLESKHSPENVLYTRVDMRKPKERIRSPTEDRDISLGAFRANHGEESPKAQELQKCSIVYSELLVPNSRSQSLPLLDDDMEDNTCFYKQSQSSQLSNSPTKGLPGLSTSLDKLCNTSLYQLAGTTGNQRMVGRRGVKVNTNDAMYAVVPSKHLSNHFPVDNTYEQIPDSRSEDRLQLNSTHTNTYETLTDLKPKQNHPARGVKAEKWKWLSPEYWKK